MSKFVLFALLATAGLSSSAFALVPESILSAPSSHHNARFKKPVSEGFRYYWQMPDAEAKVACEKNGGQWDESVGGCRNTG